MRRGPVPSTSCRPTLRAWCTSKAAPNASACRSSSSTSPDPRLHPADLHADGGGVACHRRLALAGGRYGRWSLAQKAIRVTSSARNRPRVCLWSGFRLGFQGIYGIFLEKHREQPQDRHIEAERTTAT